MSDIARMRTFAEVLKPAGYRTYAVGKWHVARNQGPDGDKHDWPRQRGFDRYYGTITGAGRYLKEVSGGRVKIIGAENATLRDLWGAKVAMIFQDPMTSLNPLMKIGKQIEEPLRNHLDMPRDEARATAKRLLQDVRIPEAERRLEQYPHELSGGMRQRVMIAIAMACGPTLLFADGDSILPADHVAAQGDAVVDARDAGEDVAFIVTIKM